MAVNGGPTRAAPAQELAIPTGAEHVLALRRSLRSLDPQLERVEAWGTRLAQLLPAGGRLFAAGNGGSAAQAQHLSAEIVGRYATDRAPLSALCLHADSSSFTAISNDYGLDEAFARQLRAHARPGDVLLCLSTSGKSANVLEAAHAAGELAVQTWALTGAGPNPLAALCDEAVCMTAPSAANVQELHLVAIHVLCGALDRALLS
jgi:D-sedoheptulose 7-phosphate isomerase